MFVRTNHKSIEYPKTENVFTRDPETHKLNLLVLRLPEFSLIKGWHLTEKIDGTNMRVVYDPFYETVEIRGRSDNAQIAGDLLKKMQDMFTLEKMSAQFDEYLGEQIDLGTTVTIFGEGYGPGIQKGGVYSPVKNFRVFDVCYHRYTGIDSWCSRNTVHMICEGLGVPEVPRVAVFFSVETALAIVQDMKENFEYSQVAEQDHADGTVQVVPEGIVGRTDPYLYDEQGRRIMWKLKVKDLP